MSGRVRLFVIADEQRRAIADNSDHAVDVALGGATDTSNGQGVCEGHNYAKQAHGWSARPRPGPRHTIETTTPTGHTYVSVAPRLGPAPKMSPAEIAVTAHLIWAA